MIESTTESQLRLVDAPARQRALDTARSFIVQAPAGSGKTELLTRRFLALLSTVDEPEEVLAITFTRAATAEMRSRIQDALTVAGKSTDEIDDELHRLASSALRHAAQRGWKLLEQPQRLNIQTIDSLALSIAHQSPLLSRLGGRLSPLDDSTALYTLAARRTIEQLGGRDAELSAALSGVLEVRDTSLADCEGLIAGMLAHRDQWLPFIPLGTGVDWHSLRAALEAPFQREHDRVLGIARGLLRKHPVLAQELLSLANYASSNECKSDLSLLREVSALDHLATSAHWNCLCHLLLTGKHAWRKQVRTDIGFPATGPAQKQRMESTLAELKEIDGLLEVLCVARSLPPTRFDDAQWALLQHIFIVLRRAVAELRIVFAEHSEIDFVEAGIAARVALATPERAESAAQLSESIRHILVDEFQDTSRPQYDLILQLLQEWQPGDGRTCFLVGDPMQSIYLFRQAEVELFENAKLHGLEREDGITWPLEFLELQTNFRSTAEIVEPLNTHFSAIFSAATSRAAASIHYAPSTSSSDRTTDEDAVHVHASFLRNSEAPERKHALHRREAQHVLEVIQNHRERIERAEAAGTPYRVAVLVRSRSHLPLIADELRRAGIRYRSVEIETLEERQEILDLVALVRALIHPMDRVAWLSVLRAPWCGLDLRDLHAICGDEISRSHQQPILTLLRERLPALSESGRRRASRILAVLEASMRARTSGVLSASPAALPIWVERTWEALGGRACLGPEGRENAEAFFRRLAQLPPNGLSLGDETFTLKLDELFARPDPLASESCGVQLMTIHKSKGLGFDAVIVPALERSTGRDDAPLLSWITRKQAGGAAEELLLAPIGRKGEDRNRLSLYSWVERQKRHGTQEEQKRLLYVACSRARSELHLFGTASVNDERAAAASPSAHPDSCLLATGWPALREIFLARWQEHSQNRSVEELPDFSVSERPGSNLLIMPRTLPPEDHSLVLDLAASAAGSASTTVSPAPPAQQLRRLPDDWQWKPPATSLRARTLSSPRTSAAPLRPPLNLTSAQPELLRAGSIESRARGIVVHALLERAAHLLATRPAHVAEDPLRAEDPRWRTATAALLNHQGVPQDKHAGLLKEVLDAFAAVLRDPTGLWLLGGLSGGLLGGLPDAQREAKSESAWSSRADDGLLHTLRADRIFLGGATPGEPGKTFLWIVDYKTAAPPPGGTLADFLSEERERHREQLERYSAALRQVYRVGGAGVGAVRGGGEPLPQRLGLYYPLLPHLDWWAAED